MAGGISKPTLDSSVSQPLKNAETATTKAAADPENRADLLEEVARELDNAIAAVEQETGKSPSTPSSPSSSSPPEITVAKRMLDVAGGNCSCSGSAPVTVDEHENYLITGEGRKKQSMAIKASLALIREQAEAARDRLADVSAAGKPPAEAEDSNAETDEDRQERDEQLLAALRKNHGAIEESLQQGSEEAERLREESAATPYAFFGLQAKALVEQGFDPAIRRLEEGVPLTEAAPLRAKLQLVDERLRWVIAFLDKSEKQFQEMIELEEIMELTHQFRKMHQITVEDLPLPLSISGNSSDGDKSPYPKLACELTDAQVQEVIAAIKLKREVLRRLAELMQDDPTLRSRLLAQGESAKKIYREELTRLRNRQQQLAETLADQRKAKSDETPTEATAPELPPAFGDLLRRRMLASADQAASAIGDARVWLPRETPEDIRDTLEERLGELSNAIDQFSHTDPADAEAMAGAHRRLEEARKPYADFLDEARHINTIGSFFDYRIEDLETLSHELDTCASLAEFLHRNDGDRFLATFQEELNQDTRRTSLGLMEALGNLGGVEPEIDEKIESLETLLTEDLSDSQRQALESLEDHREAEAEGAKRQAATQLEEGVQLLDEAMLAFLEAQPPHESPESASAQALPDPTEFQIEDALEELLRKLEREARGLPPTTLGLENQANLQIKTDWQKTPQEKEQEQKEAEQRRQQQKQQAQQAARLAAEAQARANRRAASIAKGLQKAPVLPWKDRKLQEFDGRNDWNSLPSELQESITQDFDPSVPAEYRAAIQRYFRILSESSEAP